MVEFLSGARISFAAVAAVGGPHARPELLGARMKSRNVAA